MVDYTVHRPRHIKEAVQMMADFDGALYVAGGTKVLPLVAKKKIAAKHLISLEGIGDLNDIVQLNGLRLGSGLTFGEIARNSVVQRRYTAIYDLIHSLPKRIREGKSTLGGDMCAAYPFALLAGPFYLFDAEVAAAGMYPATHSQGMGLRGGFFGSRIIRIDNFFGTYDSTILRSDEVVKEFVLPDLSPVTGSAYIRVTGKKSGLLGITGVGARVTVESREDAGACGSVWDRKKSLKDVFETMEEKGFLCRDVRLVVCYSRDLPNRLRKGEEELRGRQLSLHIAEQAIVAATGEIVQKVPGKAEAWFIEGFAGLLLTTSLIRAIQRADQPGAAMIPEPPC